MSQVPNAGCKEILFWKIFYSVTCSVFAQVLFLTALLFVMNFSIIQPVVWMKLTLATLSSLSTWLFLIPLASIIFAQGVICSKDYVFESVYCPNRMSKIISILSLRNLCLVCLHMITGALIVWLYLSLLGGQYGSIYRNCYSNDQCLVEETLFTILNGLWIGFYYFVRSFVKDGNNKSTIVFPVIQQRKLLLVKSNVIVKLNQAMHEAIWPTVYFVVLYYYRGADARRGVMGFLVLSQDKEPLQLYDMMTSSLLFYSWLFSTLFIFTMLCMRLFFEVFLTEHWVFPIESDVSHVLSLKEALAMNNIPIIQHLACLDLYMLSLWDPMRRQQLFTLSQPGGHPHNWNTLLQEILHFITDHSTELNKTSDTMMALDAAKETFDISEPCASTQKSTNTDEPLFQSPYSAQGLRNMALPKPESIDIVNVTQSDFFANGMECIRSSSVAKLAQLSLAIRKKSGVQYFFGDRPESRMYFLLSKGQPIIWAIQGLAFLTTASLKEDNYGVVQKDLPVILTTLVNLKQNLDKLNKVSVIGRKNSQCELYKMQLKAALRSAVKRSLYSICNTFGDYLPHIQLTKDIQLQVQTFISCREG